MNYDGPVNATTTENKYAEPEPRMSTEDRIDRMADRISTLEKQVSDLQSTTNLHSKRLERIESDLGL